MRAHSDGHTHSDALILCLLTLQAAMLGDLEGSSSVEGASGTAGAAFKVGENWRVNGEINSL